MRSLFSAYFVTIGALLATISCASNSPPPAPATRPAPPAFDRTPWLEDYAAMRAELERTYSNLPWFASPESGIDVPALHARTIALLESAPDAAAARAALDAFVDGFHDGHFSELNRAEPKPAGPAANIPPPAFSFPPPLACGALGFARTRGVAFSLRFEATPGFRLFSEGEPESYRSGVATLPDGRLVGILRIPSFRTVDFVAECEEAWSEIARAKPTGGTCDKSCVHTLNHRVMEIALVNLRTRLRALADAHAIAVVADLGGNGGGNDLGDWAPRAFTKSPVHSARLGIVRDPKSVEYFEDQLDDIREALKVETSEKARAALLDAKKQYEDLEAIVKTKSDCSMHWAWTERRPWKPLSPEKSCSNLIFGPMFASGVRDYMAPGELGSQKAEEAIYWPAIAAPVVGSWSGAVYEVVDGRTGSAAEITSAVFQDNKVARLIGTKTAGLGCGFMYDGPELVLPHSHIRYRIPNCVRLRADGSSEVAGIRPDIPMPTYEGEKEPERAMRYLNAIARDLH